MSNLKQLKFVFTILLTLFIVLACNRFDTSKNEINGDSTIKSSTHTDSFSIRHYNSTKLNTTITPTQTKRKLQNPNTTKTNELKKNNTNYSTQFSNTNRDSLNKLGIGHLDTIPAMFPGGEDSLREFLINHLVYDIHYTGSFHFTCKIHFTVLADGSKTNIYIEQQSGNSNVDNESLRLVRKMPNFIPAKVNGIAIVSEFTLPLTFESDDEF